MNFRISRFGLGALWLLDFIGAALGVAIGKTISVVLLGGKFFPVGDTIFFLVACAVLASAGVAVVRFLFGPLDKVPHGSPDTPTIK